VAAGGLHVIGTTRHESVRIDNQLRGRAGRQGDPGSSRFIISLDDDIWKKFGKAKISEIRAQLRQQHPHGEPIESPKVRRILRMLQRKVDLDNADTRRDVLKYDLVVHVQRETIYKWRRTLVTGEGYEPEAIIEQVIADIATANPERRAVCEALRAHFHESFHLSAEEHGQLAGEALKQALALLARREKIAGRDTLRELGRRLLLEAIDDLWTDHLSNLERIEEGIGLYGYAEIDPVIEWKKQATTLWNQTLQLIRSRAVTLWFLVDTQKEPTP